MPRLGSVPGARASLTSPLTVCQLHHQERHEAVQVLLPSHLGHLCGWRTYMGAHHKLWFKPICGSEHLLGWLLAFIPPSLRTSRPGLRANVI